MAVKPGQGPDDPKGLIHEAFRIDGITEAECRSIFLDWALSYPGDTSEAIPRLIAAQDAPDHPMTDVLRAGLADAPQPSRRGGRAARLGQTG
ncbi:hypothetical protein [Jannaschia seohaensis]|uniref:Uncharacterized protein n=1 Tax=Jannaschia seohaensis TaxID=475081 RepID=A0A2Y9ABC6_9RHOB|nr:hypothetical protein [Jannaschia seohaensis]PWJ20846.1 hypothetical protein BCF38_10292 [Jannaschia seohaensis]SSA41256.1 hypothetical protein SAMN05421539_10292 [Jannaschia seohaensis]